MKNICVKLIQRENKKYRKMLSSEETIFPEFDPESASTSPYTPGATLQDDDWFCITNAKGQEYSIETRFVKGIFLIRERPAHNHDRALSK